MKRHKVRNAVRRVAATMLLTLLVVSTFFGMGSANASATGTPSGVRSVSGFQHATPESGSVSITECSLAEDIPIVTQLLAGDDPLAQTAIYLTVPEQFAEIQRGELTIGCAGEGRAVLAENVVSAWAGPWPGIAGYAVLPPGVDDITQQQQGYVELATGRAVLFGPSWSEIAADRFSVEGSPWVAGPSLDDPSEVLIADLRTFETQAFETVAEFPHPDAPLLISLPSDEGSIGIAFAQSGSFDANGGVYVNSTAAGAPDGILVLGASFDDVRWLDAPEGYEQPSPMALSPDGRFVATISSDAGQNFPETYSYGLIDLTSGALVATSEVVQFTGSPRIVWVQDGAAAVFLSGSTLQMLEVDGTGAPVTLFDAGETLSDLRTTWSPDVVVATERKNRDSEADPAQTATDVVFSINVTTGETLEFAGTDASGMIGWIGTTGALVMMEWLDTPSDLTSYQVFDPVSGEQIGEILDALYFQTSGMTPMIVGPDSIANTGDGRVEVFTLRTQHVYVFATGPDDLSMTQIPAPAGLLAQIPLVANVYLSPDGSQLSLTGEGDEGRTRYLTSLADPGEWIVVEANVAGGPAPIAFVTGLDS